MADDADRLALSEELIDIVIAEVKTNQPCTLNGPWTREDRQNVHRVLAAIGCMPSGRIDEAAASIYQVGCHVSDHRLRVRLLAVGRERSQSLVDDYPEVVQVTWVDLLAFIWNRFYTYRQQKTQVDQWDATGRAIKDLADQEADAGTFVDRALRLMGVQNVNQTG